MLALFFLLSFSGCSDDEKTHIVTFMKLDGSSITKEVKHGECVEPAELVESDDGKSYWMKDSLEFFEGEVVDFSAPIMEDVYYRETVLPPVEFTYYDEKWNVIKHEFLWVGDKVEKPNLYADNGEFLGWYLCDMDYHKATEPYNFDRVLDCGDITYHHNLVANFYKDVIETFNFNCSSYEIFVGDTMDTEWYVIPESRKGDAKFRSWNPDIVSIDSNGYITGLSAGEGQIEIYIDGEDVSLRSTVIVSEKPKYVFPQEFKFNDKFICVNLKDKINFKYTITPSDADNQSIKLVKQEVYTDTRCVSDWDEDYKAISVGHSKLTFETCNGLTDTIDVYVQGTVLKTCLYNSNDEYDINNSKIMLTVRRITVDGTNVVITDDFTGVELEIVSGEDCIRLTGANAYSLEVYQNPSEDTYVSFILKYKDKFGEFRMKDPYTILIRHVTKIN